MSNSVDPDETAHCEPSHLDLRCLQKPILIACGSERENTKWNIINLSINLAANGFISILDKCKKEIRFHFLTPTHRELKKECLLRAMRQCCLRDTSIANAKMSLRDSEYFRTGLQNQWILFTWNQWILFTWNQWILFTCNTSTYSLYANEYVQMRVNKNLKGCLWKQRTHYR